jgi:anaerobic magnesium-protoporphyrin IX monomethyl ester cyclase
MKILLINPNSTIAGPDSIYSRFVPPVAPCGIAYIAALLEKNGFEVIVVDQYANKMSNEELSAMVNAQSPQMVGFSCLTPVISNVRALVERIRFFKKDIKIVLGNIHATMFADELLNERIADIVVRGEGEFSMLETARAIREKKTLDAVKGISFIKDGKAHHTPDREVIQNLDDLPYPAWHLFRLDDYNTHPMISLYKTTLPIQASRGCPYKCTFCSQDTIYKKPRYRKIVNIIDEIEYIYTNMRISHFVFIDAYFPFSIEYGLKFCEELMRRGMHKKITWVTETRVDKVNLELLKRMKEAGLHLLMYGFEVGNQKVLDSINKKTTLEHARQAMKDTKKAKILSLGLFILGLPGENKQTCEDTIRFAKELDCDIAKFNIAVPLPGSKFFENFKGKLSSVSEPEKFTSWSNWASMSEDLIYAPEGMSGKELTDLQKKAMLEFYVRPKLILKYIFKRIIPLKDLFFGARILVGKYPKAVIDRMRNSREISEKPYSAKTEKL